MDQDLAKQVADLAAGIAELHDKVENQSERHERMDRLAEEVGRLSEELRSTDGRKGQASQVDAEKVIRNTNGKAALNTLLRTESEAPEIAEFHQHSDELYILGNLLGVRPNQLDYYRELMQKDTILKGTAINQTDDMATAGDTWYPVEFSASMKENVKLSRRIAALHDRIPMPTDPYKLPIEGADASAYIVSEATSATEHVTGASLIKATLSTPAFTNMTLTTKKLGARVVTSTEVEEASIIPILPYVRDKLVRAMVDAEEDVTINGNPAGNLGGGSYADSLDKDGTAIAADSPIKAWAGYRDIAPYTSCVDAGGTTEVTIANLRQIRANMGKYATNPMGNVWIAGPIGYIKMLGARDQSGNAVLQTVDKYGGDRATLVTGELGRLDGIPVVVSELVRENTSEWGNVLASGTADRTMILLVNRPSFVYGDFRPMRLRNRDLIETDQQVLVVLQRLTFNTWYGAVNGGGDKVCLYVYNIKNS